MWCCQGRAALSRVCAVVNSQWRRDYRQAGVSEQDWERMERAFVYEGVLK